MKRPAPPMTARPTLRGRHRTALLLIGLAGVVPLLRSSDLSAAASLTVTPITWNVAGLDSNDVNVGPNHFPVAARVCNTGDAPATNVTSSFVWDSGDDTHIRLRPDTLTDYIGGNVLPSLAAGACHDFYYEVEIIRTPSAYDKTRRYHITAGATSLPTVSSPTPREIYVERLISQSRNSVSDVKLNGTSIPAGGSMTLVVGQTYTIALVASTATNGYEQLATFVSFPNTIFQVLSVSTTYTADSSAYVSSPNDKLYGDACLWMNDPNSPVYRSCLDVGKVGGNITVTYQVKILSVPSINPEPLETLVFDFSGSSYHYNADYSTSARFAAVVDPTTLTIAKKLSPNPTVPGGVSALTFTITNPNPALLSGLSFTDVFPTSPGAMVVAPTPGAVTSGCGTPSPAFAPPPGASSISFSGGTVAANGTCTVQVNVTAPTVGSYVNTSTHLLVGGTDTGKFATDTLVVSTAPAPPAPTCGVPLAQWVFPTAFSTTAPAPYAPNTTVTASASPGAGLTPISNADNHTVTPTGTLSWGSNGAFDSTGALNTSFNDYFQFAVDTTNLSSVNLSFWARRPTGNSPNQILVYYGTSATPPGTLHTTIGNPPATKFPSAANTWESSGTLSFASGLNSSGLTYFRIYGAWAGNNNPGSDLYLDDVTFTGCEIPPPPTITKSFSPNPVAVGAASTLSFTVTNVSPRVALTGVAFTDVLPAGLTVTDGSAAACGGTLTRTAATRTLALTAGTLAAGGSCTVTASVTATTAGPHDNVSGLVSSTQSGTNTTSIASASLTAVKPPVIDKLFAPNPVLAGGVTRLTFTITNPNLNNGLAGVAFTDNLPTSPGAMVVAATPGVVLTGCGVGAAVTATAGSATVSLSGATLTAGGTCTVALNVTPPVAGDYANTSLAVSHIIDSATVSGNAATDTLTVAPSSPAIALLKQIGPTASGPWSSFLVTPVGGNVFYRFTVENTGNVPLTSVSVSDPNVTMCSLPTTLPVASPTQDPTASCVTSAISAVSGSHPNTATANGTSGATNVSDTSTATYGTTALSITKSATESFFTAAGDTLHYSFVVTNSGFAALAGPVVVSDDKATDESCPSVNTVGDLDSFLDPGESVTCSATYLVTPADVTVKSVANQASATAGGVTSNTATKTVPLGALSIAKSATEVSFQAAGDVLHYGFAVTNTGSASLAGPVVVSDDKATDESCPAVTTVGNLDGSLDPGESITCTATYTVTSADVTAGSVTNHASATAGGVTSNTATKTVPRAALSIVKSAAESRFHAPGDVLHYSFVVTNTGSSPLAGPVVVSDDKSTDESCPNVNTVGNSDGFLDPGESVTCTATYTVTPGDVEATLVTNHAFATAGTGVSNTATKTVPLAALSIVKNVTEASFTAAGNILHYTFLVSNTGAASLAGPVVVSDDKATDESCPDVNTVGNLDGFLDGGESVTCTATYTVTPADVTAKSVTNHASATADGVTSNTATASVPLAGSATDLAVTITDGSATYTPGGGLTYTIVVTNLGPTAVTGATVTDTFPATLVVGAWTCTGSGGGSCPANGSGNISSLVDLPVGASVTFTVPVTVGIGATGYLTNTATVAPPAGITDTNLSNNSASDTNSSGTATQACAPGWTRQVYDWNGKTFDDGVPFSVGGVSVTASRSGGFNAGTPFVDGVITGGTGGDTLRLEHIGAAGVNPAVLTLSFSVPVNDLRFALHDVDACDNAAPPQCATVGSRWRDQLTLASSPITALVLAPATPINSVSGAVVTGDQSAADATANGNVDVEHTNNVSSATLSFDNTGTYDGVNANLDAHAIAMSSFSFCEPGATLAVISGVSSFREAALSVLEWRTAAEAGTLGFHVFRLDPASNAFVKVNDGMVLGLLDAAQGGTYHLVDPSASVRGESTYRIEEVTMTGLRNAYGPFTVPRGDGHLGSGEGAELSERGSARRAHPLNAEVSPAPARTPLASAANGVGTLKIGVVEDGLTWLSTAEISTGLGIPAGSVGPLLRNRLLTLRTRGKEVSWTPAPGGDGILFYGQTLPNAFTAENVYWLTRSGLFRGRVMATVDGGAPVAVPAASFREVTRTERNLIALTSLEARPDSDFWYWDVVATGGPKTFATRVEGPVNTGESARLTLRGRGATEESHQLGVEVGGTPVGQATARGTAFFTFGFDVPAALLKEGTVDVRVTRLADGSSDGAVFVDSLELSYRRASLAVKDEVTLHADGTGVVTVDGLKSAAVTVLDVSDPLAPALVVNPAVAGSGPYRVSFVPHTADGRFLVASSAALRKPAWTRPAAEPTLKDVSNEGRYLVIHPAELAGTAAALVGLRSGMKPKAVSLDAIYDEFAYGLRTPTAMRDFVAHAASSWSVPPKYVVLVGNGTFDYRNHWGRNDNLLPPLLVSTNPGGLFSSDNLLADVDGDGLPDLSIGRIPAVDDAQGLAYVRKLAAYQSSAGAWKATALLAADRTDAVDYAAESRELASRLPAGYTRSTVYLHEHPLSEARRLLIDQLNQGVGLVNWTGHGGTDRLSKDGLLTLEDLPSLVSKDRFPLMSATTCVINRFEYPGYASLGEQLVLKENGGAVAVWSSSALSFPEVARELSTNLFDVYREGSQPIGDAVREALRRYAVQGHSMAHVHTYVLLGDPAAGYVAP